MCIQLFKERKTVLTQSASNIECMNRTLNHNSFDKQDLFLFFLLLLNKSRTARSNGRSSNVQSYDKKKRKEAFTNFTGNQNFLHYLENHEVMVQN